MHTHGPYSHLIARYPRLFGHRPAPAPTPTTGAPWQDPGVRTILDRLAMSVRPSRPARPAGRFHFRTDSKSFKVYGATGATWLAGTKWDPTTAKRVVEEAKKAGTIPVIAQYAIPGRDNKGPSAGGARDLEAYKAQVTANAKAIGDAPALIVIEPDGLALGLNAEAVKAAVQIFRQHSPNARLYVDAGHSSWKKPHEVAQLLVRGGIAQADGFALNVSAFQWTSDNMAFGDQVIAELKKLDPALGNKQYVVDTSRNGNGPGVDEKGKSTWGDPVRAKNGGPIMNGPKPTFDTGNPNAAAFVWVKGPGHGDNRIRRAGEFGGEKWVKHNPNPPLGPR